MLFPFWKRDDVFDVFRSPISRIPSKWHLLIIHNKFLAAFGQYFVQKLSKETLEGVISVHSFKQKAESSHQYFDALLLMLNKLYTWLTYCSLWTCIFLAGKQECNSASWILLFPLSSSFLRNYSSCCVITLEHQVAGCSLNFLNHS